MVRKRLPGFQLVHQFEEGFFSFAHAHAVHRLFFLDELREKGSVWPPTGREKVKSLLELPIEGQLLLMPAGEHVVADERRLVVPDNGWHVLLGDGCQSHVVARPLEDRRQVLHAQRFRPSVADHEKNLHFIPHTF
jgi:hypothetical protein